MSNKIHDLDTPCLLLDRDRLETNLERMKKVATSRSTLLRPHLKTSKSLEVASLALKASGGGATVSTLKEAEVLGRSGAVDLLYAVAISPQKLKRVAGLRAEGIDLKVVVDNVEMAEHLSAFYEQTGQTIPTLIELDLDGHRSGVRPEDSIQLLAIGRELDRYQQLRGVMAHAGESYALSDPADLQHSADNEAKSACAAAQTLCNSGLPCPIVSIGSTPTALMGTSYEGVTELRAGVFMFFDLVQSGVGVCRKDDIALSVLSTVISTNPDASRLVIDAGWMALSRDRGTASQAEDYGYGQVCLPDGIILTDVLVLDAQQEHGIIGVRRGSSACLPKLSIGDQLRILPNHACATAAQHGAYHVINKQAEVEAIWPRFSGW
ncbi:alanine racemase [Kiloniella spongiae]|uniref:Alanine racemase n=1 Tax=Kiloniella spongiae TaxID=1489064 RepID=A0A0H2MHH8_9PROT|nr:alanine racemase [Kiloniella spongiae]KLN62019.1 alanine racemase [Kiloniella spongiae]